VTSNNVFVAAGTRGLAILHSFTPVSSLSLTALPPVQPDFARLTVQGIPGLNVQIERSTDLTHWQSWTNALLGSGPLEFRDPQANSIQFYRALAP
jgi:hypothetical protein